MLKPSAQKVQDVLAQFGHHNVVIELEETARTAEDAAHALQCDVGQIVKSLVFKGHESQTPYLLLVSGRDRVDLEKATDLLGEPLRRADADWVKEQTGFAIGGVPPVGHAKALTTIMDNNLLDYPTLWAAAGHPFAVFPSSPESLLEITHAACADIHAVQ